MAIVNAIVIGNTYDPETNKIVLNIRYIREYLGVLSDHLVDYYFTATTDHSAIVAGIKQVIIDQQVNNSGPLDMVAGDIVLMFAPA